MNKQLSAIAVCSFMLLSSVQVSAMEAEKKQEEKEYGLEEFKAENPWLFGAAVMNFDELKLSQKNIKNMSWIGLIPGLKNVKRLHLNSNAIENLRAVAFTQSLLELNVGFNKISRVDLYNQLGCLSHLTRLHLEHNNLKDIKKVFVGLSALEFIWLSNNKIEQIEEGTFPPSILCIYLGCNEIKSIAPNVFKGLVNLNVIDFANNKLIGVDFATLPDSEECEIDLNRNPIKFFANESRENKSKITLSKGCFTDQQIIAFKECNPNKNVQFDGW